MAGLAGRIDLAERYSDHLHRLADSIWEAHFNHPFVKGIGDGSLDVEKLKYWVRQDYLFLTDYARIHSLASARSPDLDTMSWFAGMAESTLKVEMGLHRSYARDFGIGEAELEQERKGPACQGFTDFLMRAAAVEPFEVLVAAILPCLWAFYEKGCRLADQPLPQTELYARWIKTYSNPEFGKDVEKCRILMDRLGADASAERKGQMEQAFIVSSRYEYLFWEMCYTRQTWPV